MCPQQYKLYTIFIPTCWRFFLLTNNKRYLVKLYNNYYYYKFSLPNGINNISYNSQLSVLSFAFYNQRNTYNFWLNSLNELLFLFSSFAFQKIKFKGKGYYIYKNVRNTITPQFGFSHRIYIYAFFNKVNFLSKTKVIIFGLVKSDIISTAYSIKYKRPINIFTGRGVRFNSQVVYKKTGKVSSYR